MIYEFRTYDLKPHMQPEFEKRFGEAYEKRKQFSPLAAFWHTEIGPLNQVIHVWPYKDLAERDRIRAEAVKAGVWPPKTSELIARQRSEIFLPFSFSPEMKPGKQGPFFEMRVYTYGAGQLGNLTKAWELAIPNRLKAGPATAILYSELGDPGAGRPRSSPRRPDCRNTTWCSRRTRSACRARFRPCSSENARRMKDERGRMTLPGCSFAFAAPAQTPTGRQ
jgi:hypothetical protein